MIGFTSALTICDKFKNSPIMCYFDTDIGYVAPTVNNDIKPLNNFMSDVSVISNEYKGLANIPFKGIFVDDYSIITVQINNTSGETWLNQERDDGSGRVSLGYRWYKINEQTDEKEMQCISEGRALGFGKDINPNEGIVKKVHISYPKESGEYALVISLLQEGVAWFDSYDANSAEEIRVQVQ